MYLISDTDRADGFRWRCPVCRKHTDIRVGSFMEYGNVSPVKLLKLLYLWANDWEERPCAEMTGLSVPTVSLHFQRFRLACLLWVWAHPVAIGGPGHIIEVDETQLSRKRRAMGRALPGSDIWVYGGIDRDTGERFMEVVPDRSTRTLMKVTERHVEPGTDIYHDSWPAYKFAAWGGASPWDDHVVNHHEGFVNPVTGVHTQNVERMWRSFKDKKVRAQGIPRDDAPGYCAEHLLRQQWKTGNPFEEAIKVMKDVSWAKIRQVIR